MKAQIIHKGASIYRLGKHRGRVVTMVPAVSAWFMPPRLCVVTLCKGRWKARIGMNPLRVHEAGVAVEVVDEIA